MELTSKEYYLWESYHTNKPWNRYLDYEFLETERKRIKDVEKWFNLSYVGAKDGEKVEEVCYYCVPNKISKPLLNSLFEYEEGEFEIKGLSAVYNSLQFPLTMLIPKGRKVPKDYSPVRIISARRKVLINKDVPKEEACFNALIVEDWEELPADFIYKDLPYEKRLVSKLIYENLNRDEHVASSFQAPIISSPIVLNGNGGVSFSSLLRNTPFVLELIKTLQRMLPPEQRTMLPIPSLLRGRLVDINGGIKFHVAERPPRSDSILSCSYGNSYKTVNEELGYRDSFGGEYSFIASIAPLGSRLDVFRTMLKRFNQTVITAFNMDRLKEDAGLQNLNKSIDLNLHLSIVNCKQINPRIDKNAIGEEALSNFVRKDWDMFLAQMGLNSDERDFSLNIRVQRTVDNILKLSQSLARSELKQEVEEKHIKEARQIFKTNAEEFLGQPEVRGIKDYLKQHKKNERVDTITTLLENGGLTLNEIWEEIKQSKLFKDIKDLQDLLEWMNKKAKLWKHPNSKYFVL